MQGEGAGEGTVGELFDRADTLTCPLPNFRIIVQRARAPKAVRLSKVDPDLACPTPPSICKEILVETLHLNNAADPDSDTELDHQLGQSIAVDQYDPLLEILHIVERLLTECAGRYKNSLGCPKADQTSNEALDGWTPNCLFRTIALCLNIYPVEPTPKPLES